MMFKNILQKSQISKNKLSIYFSSSESNGFCFGTIEFCDEKQFIIGSYTPYGEDDGFILRKIDDVTKIETDSKYTEKMISLIEMLGTKHATLSVNDNDVVKYLIKKAKSNYRIISIELLDSEELVVGYIQSISYPMCEIKQINEYGEEDGLLIFNIDDVSSIRIESKDELMLERLYLTKCKTNQMTSSN